mmetsp:Transcript_18850/g.43337  ORF Transcript_18850/g.43337 Transcript_18850/m.43337 type:complete len:203 (-) Transcript_18850:6868-7476(-)
MIELEVGQERSLAQTEGQQIRLVRKLYVLDLESSPDVESERKLMMLDLLRRHGNSFEADALIICQGKELTKPLLVLVPLQDCRLGLDGSAVVLEVADRLGDHQVQIPLRFEGCDRGSSSELLENVRAPPLSELALVVAEIILPDRVHPILKDAGEVLAADGLVWLKRLDVCTVLVDVRRTVILAERSLVGSRNELTTGNGNV